MKYLKLSDPLIDNILIKGLNKIGLVNDKDQVALDDQLEFFNNSNVAFGLANISKIIVEKYTKTSSFIDSLEIVGSIPKEGDIITVIEFQFIPFKHPKKLGNDIDLNVEEIKIYADGGSRGNPGPSASGYVLMTMEGQIIKQNGVYLGITTNNQAEYKALLFALKDAIELNARKAFVYMDSLLVVNQIKGIYKIKNIDLKPIHQEIVSLFKYFEVITFTHVPRELNKLADTEVNKCLDILDSN